MIVAHPDDETLWAGGTILSNPSWKCFIVCLCRKSDTERAQKFSKVLEILKSDGNMGDLDDGPDQKPLDEKVLEGTILDLLPPVHFDLVITHNPKGEYTRHLRHEETGIAVQKLWDNGKISAKELWTFAYDDNDRRHLPLPLITAPFYLKLANDIWQQKYNLITETYGFEKDSWEAKTTPRAEAFWKMEKLNPKVNKLTHHESISNV